MTAHPWPVPLVLAVDVSYFESFFAAVEPGHPCLSSVGLLAYSYPASVITLPSESTILSVGLAPVGLKYTNASSGASIVS